MTVCSAHAQHNAQTHVLRPSKYKPWDDDTMQKALQAVKLEGSSERKAALDYGMPRSTLADRVSGRVSHGVVSGPPVKRRKKSLLGFF